MAYQIHCRGCGVDTWATNIIALFDDHTTPAGRFTCSGCKGQETYIHRVSELQEEGEVWERWIKGAIRIETGMPTYSPYVFLTSDAEDGDITGLHFHYYKDTRSRPRGRLKHGHGPGGPPVLGIEDLFVIIQHLVSAGALSKERVKTFAATL